MVAAVNPAGQKTVHVAPVSSVLARPGIWQHIQGHGSGHVQLLQEEEVEAAKFFAVAGIDRDLDVHQKMRLVMSSAS